jgi:hypothetical protein
VGHHRSPENIYLHFNCRVFGSLWPTCILEDTYGDVLQFSGFVVFKAAREFYKSMKDACGLAKGAEYTHNDADRAFLENGLPRREVGLR